MDVVQVLVVGQISESPLGAYRACIGLLIIVEGCFQCSIVQSFFIRSGQPNQVGHPILLFGRGVITIAYLSE